MTNDRRHFCSVILVSTFALIISGCVSTISLRRSPSDLVLVSVQPNSRATVAYFVTSKVSDPYEYKNRAGYKFVFPISKTFKDNLDAYMSTKFNKIEPLKSSDSLYSLNFELKSFAVEYQLEQSTLEGLSSALGNRVEGDAIVDVSMSVFVKVARGDSVLAEKNIISTTKSNKRLEAGTKVENIYADAVNDAFSKSIIMIDKYLLSVGL